MTSVETVQSADNARQLTNVVVAMQPQSQTVDELHHEIGELQTTLVAIQKQLLDAKTAVPLATCTLGVLILTVFVGGLSFFASFAGKPELAGLFFVPFVAGLLGTIGLWLASYWK